MRLQRERERLRIERERLEREKLEAERERLRFEREKRERERMEIAEQRRLEAMRSVATRLSSVCRASVCGCCRFEDRQRAIKRPYDRQGSSEYWADPKRSYEPPSRCV